METRLCIAQALAGPQQRDVPALRRTLDQGVPGKDEPTQLLLRALPTPLSSASLMRALSACWPSAAIASSLNNSLARALQLSEWDKRRRDLYARLGMVDHTRRGGHPPEWSSNMTVEDRDMNRDPISKAPGAHPIGVGVGGVGGAAVGAGVGALFGPIGMLVGGAIGTLAGAAAGKGVAEGIDPTGEADYWRTEYQNRPYANSQYTYDNDYAPAYAYGNTVRSEYAGRTWDDSLENDIRSGWEKAKDKSQLTWEQAKAAVRDAFD